MCGIFVALVPCQDRQVSEVRIRLAIYWKGLIARLNQRADGHPVSSLIFLSHAL